MDTPNLMIFVKQSRAGLALPRGVVNDRYINRLISLTKAHAGRLKVPETRALNGRQRGGNKGADPR